MFGFWIISKVTFCVKEFVGVVTSHIGYQVVEGRTQKLETIRESYAIDLNGKKLLRVRGNDLKFCIWIVKVFDDEMRIVRLRIMHEERDEVLIVPFLCLSCRLELLQTGAMYFPVMWQ